jgi:hypothetical protein
LKAIDHEVVTCLKTFSSHVFWEVVKVDSTGRMRQFGALLLPLFLVGLGGAFSQESVDTVRTGHGEFVWACVLFRPLTSYADASPRLRLGRFDSRFAQQRQQLNNTRRK